ncbi:MAG: hypothetical protein AB7S70_06580 [Hyphomicrobium sp.]|uniref:hypothetical protein n=1 Tax=Hyphomicrobium sp. TaxID=82 RepID=UPI003D0D4EFC
MTIQTSEFRIQGKSFQVPMRIIEGREVVSVGRWLRVATINDDEWLEGELVSDPERFADDLIESGLPADIFVYSGPLEGAPVNSRYHTYMENAAVIRTDQFKQWWEGLPQEARKNARRAAKKGIEMRSASLDDALAAGIKAIYDETPLRQGRKFWHYGKGLAAVKAENSSYLDRSEFIGAYYAGELVGFLKFVRIGDTARIMQILCMNAHQDKRPIIALIVKAAETCHEKGIKYFIYGRMKYGNKTDSMTEFKRRLGFSQMNFPRYYIPLTLRGRIGLALGLHKSLHQLLPSAVIDRLLVMRSWWLRGRGQA